MSATAHCNLRKDSAASPRSVSGIMDSMSRLIRDEFESLFRIWNGAQVVKRRSWKPGDDGGLIDVLITDQRTAEALSKTKR